VHFLDVDGFPHGGAIGDTHQFGILYGSDLWICGLRYKGLRTSLVEGVPLSGIQVSDWG
jgi:hypothetical protein